MGFKLYRLASGGYRGRSFSQIAKTPCYLTIGEKEGKDRVRQFQLLFENIRLAGGDAKYDVLPKLDHPETCVQSFTDERIGWVFGNR